MPKRSPAGSIRQRPNGLWEARVTLPADAGPAQRLSRYAPTEAAARAILATLLADQQAGTLIAERVTLNALLDRWLIYLDQRANPRPGSKRPASLRPTTLRMYRGYADRYLRPRLGAKIAADLKPLHVQALLDYWADRLGAKTTRHILEVLRTALNYGVRWELVARNVAAGRQFDLPPLAPPAITPLTAAEARHVLLVAAGERHAALWTILIALGLRIGEALGLRWADYDPAARTLRIARQVQRIEGAMHVLPPKTAASVRVLDVPARVALALAGRRTEQAGEARDPDWPDWIFTRLNGKPLDEATAWKAWHRLCLRAGIVPRSVHSCRHSCATILLGQGVPLPVVSKMLGHSTLAVTADVYSHWTRDQARIVADVMDTVLEADGG